VLLEFDLLAAGADVRRESLSEEELADVVVVVAPVQAESLGVILVGDRAADRDRGQRRL
jgi:hypothetical protein